MERLMLFQYFVWHFFDVPKEILKAWENYLSFNLNYFSVSTLIKTYFSHWHKYYFPYPKGFNPGMFFESLVGNMISRIIGMILRTFLIIFGIIAEVFVFLAGALIFLLWLILPVLVLAIFITGLKLLV